jgi:ABC-type branched-subunit amino acid transport system substrate-binding protein
MKTNTFTLLLFLVLPGMLIAQQSKAGQNPRAQEAYENYRQQLDVHERTMSSTMDLTYEAYDPMVEKARRKEERREFRRELRLERARNRFANPFFRPYGYFRWPYPTW